MAENTDDQKFKLQIISAALLTSGAVSFGAGFTIYTLPNLDEPLFFSRGVGAMILGTALFSFGIIIPLMLKNK